MAAPASTIRNLAPAAAAADPNYYVVCFDFETTQLKAAKGGIVEMAALAAAQGDAFCKLVRPEPLEISEGAQAVHGITTEMLKDQRPFRDVWTIFVEWCFEHNQGCQPVLMIAHNCFGFDLPWLQAQGVVIPEWMHFADSLVAARQLATPMVVQASNKWAKQSPPHSPNKLEELAKRHLTEKQRANVQYHRALGDTRILHMLLYESGSLKGLCEATLATAKPAAL